MQQTQIFLTVTMEISIYRYIDESIQRYIDISIVTVKKIMSAAFVHFIQKLLLNKIETPMFTTQVQNNHHKCIYNQQNELNDEQDSYICVCFFCFVRCDVQNVFEIEEKKLLQCYCIFKRKVLITQGNNTILFLFLYFILALGNILRM